MDFFGRPKTNGNGGAEKAKTVTLVAETPVKNRVWNGQRHSQSQSQFQFQSQNQSQWETQTQFLGAGFHVNAVPSPPLTSSPLPAGDVFLGETPRVGRVSRGGVWEVGGGG